LQGRVSRICTLLLSLCFLSKTYASGESAEVSSEELQGVISTLNITLHEQYIFPEISQKISKLTAFKLANGDYNSYKNGRELAEKLTEDIHSVSHDRHLKVYFDPKAIQSMGSDISEKERQRIELEELIEQRAKNFGFNQVAVLEGNIGYIDLRSFQFPEHAIETLKASMAFVQNTDSLIFDLRKNRGGSPSMVQLMISYLVEAEPVLLNDIYKRNLNLTKQYWSLPFVPGKRRPDVDVYILTSTGTFSAAEDFSYTLKYLKRATIIGEVTGGGAHAGGIVPFTERFLVWVPTSRTINPNTKSNWEGNGVKPHIEVRADDALEAAHKLALETQLEKGIGDHDINQWYLEHKEALLNKHTLSERLKRQYAGNYGLRTLKLEKGELYYQRRGSPPLKLTPINDTLFMVEGKNHFRIKVVIDSNKITSIEGLTDTGSISRSAREN
jgi:hypothetical protein